MITVWDDELDALHDAYTRWESAMWDDEFERIVRRLVPGLPPDEPLDAGLRLPEHGLDRVAGMALVAALETQYQVTLHDDPGVRLVFATIGTLWAAVAELLVEI